MIVFRSIRLDDVDAFFALAATVGPGMTTLKADRPAIEARTALAAASFAGTVEPSSADYVFVLEELGTRQIVGVSAIKAGIGLDEPFYTFRVGKLVHASRELGVYSCKQTLFLSNDFTGCAELCSLFLAPASRVGSNGKLLSKGRLMFAASFPQLLPDVVMAEMRGYQREDGSSPVWDSLGRHFFRMDFARADDMSTLGQKSFIAELMPRFPVYTDFLSDEAQQALGQVHAGTVPARRLLEQEGLRFDGYVDIFDGGACLHGHLKDLRIARDSVLACVRAAPAPRDAVAVLVSSTRREDFRAIVTQGRLDDGQFALDAAEREALNVAPGDAVRLATLNPAEHLHAAEHRHG